MELQYLSGQRRRRGCGAVVNNEKFRVMSVTQRRDSFSFTVLERTFTNIHVWYVQPQLCSSPLSSFFPFFSFLFPYLISPPRRSAPGRIKHSCLVFETRGVWSSESKSRQRSSLCFGNPRACLCACAHVRLCYVVLLREARKKKRNNVMVQLWLITQDKICCATWTFSCPFMKALKKIISLDSVFQKTSFSCRSVKASWAWKSAFCIFFCCPLFHLRILKRVQEAVTCRPFHLPRAMLNSFPFNYLSYWGQYPPTTGHSHAGNCFLYKYVQAYVCVPKPTYVSVLTF